MPGHDPSASAGSKETRRQVGREVRKDGSGSRKSVDLRPKAISTGSSSARDPLRLGDISPKPEPGSRLRTSRSCRRAQESRIHRVDPSLSRPPIHRDRHPLQRSGNGIPSLRGNGIPSLRGNGIPSLRGEWDPRASVGMGMITRMTMVMLEDTKASHVDVAPGGSNPRSAPPPQPKPAVG